MDLDALCKAHNWTEEHATLASWVIFAPWAHPFWHSYQLVLVHLRPMNDGRPTKMYLPDATHEMWLEAINPEWKLNLLEHPATLRPTNFAAQWVESSDDSAREKIAKCVREICNGTLSPDTDFTQAWIARFNDRMIRGNSARAGETKIIIQNGEQRSEVVFDPKAPDAKPQPGAGFF